jgi:hypothetical protein
VKDIIKAYDSDDEHQKARKDAEKAKKEAELAAKPKESGVDVPNTEG